MEAMVLPGLVVGTALVAAGLLKVGRAERVRATVADLEVPAILAREWVVRALPAAEVVLGLLVVAVPGRLALVPLVPALALLLAYVVLVGRVVLRGQDVACACFGSEEPVTRLTLARNVLLAAAAAVAVVDAARGTSTSTRLAALSPSGWGWLAGALAVAGLTALTVSRRTPARGARPETGEQVLGADQDAGVRGIPFLPVQEPDGTLTSLPELARLRPQLLVHLSETCSHCAGVGDLLPAWRERLPGVDIRVLTGTPAGAAVPPEWARPVHDPSFSVATVLGLGLPSAVLLGADALIAGGPVHGRSGVVALLEEMEEVLAEQAAQAR